MIDLNRLLAKKAQYEHEKLFIEAKIAVVDDMIADEKVQCVEQVIEENQEIDEGIVLQDESC